MSMVLRQKPFSEPDRSTDTVAEEYDRLCSAMDGFAWYRDQRILELISNSVPATCRRGLDIGCGTGIVLHYLAKKHPDVQWTGIDKAPEMVTRTKSKCASLLNVKASRINWSKLHDNFQIGSFDFILIKNVVHLIDDPVEHLSTLSNILSSTGRILLVETVSPNSESKKFVSGLSMVLGKMDLKRHIFTARDFLQIVRAANLEILKVQYEDQFIEIKKWLDAKARSRQISDHALAYLSSKMNSDLLRRFMKFEPPGDDFPGRMLRRQILIQCLPRRNDKTVSK